MVSKEAREAMQSEGLEMWLASNSPGSPLIITGLNDGGLSLSLFVKDNDLIGVLVYDEFRLETAAGTIHAEALREELGLIS